jgi:hypothetical protein
LAEKQENRKHIEQTVTPFLPVENKSAVKIVNINIRVGVHCCDSIIQRLSACMSFKVEN